MPGRAHLFFWALCRGLLMTESQPMGRCKDSSPAPEAFYGASSYLPGSPATSLSRVTGAGAIDTARTPIAQAFERSPELQLLYETAPIGLAFLTPDCRYLQINRHLTEICGLSVADHIGRSVRDTVPQVADQVEHIVQTILQTGKSISGIEVKGQRVDGGNAERVWITHWHPLGAPDGTVLGINVVAEEITARKRAEAALAASETRFHELADNMSQFAWTADAKGRIYWYNKRWHDYAGTTLEQMKGWGWRKMHHPDHVERVVEGIRQSFDTGIPWEDTFPLRGRDGTYRWFLSRAMPIRNEAGDLVRWFGTHTDLTEQIKAETALRNFNETLEQRVEAEAQDRARIWKVSQDLIVVTDIEGRFVAVNPAWNATLGWSEGDLLNKTSEWLVHPDDWEKTRAQQGRVAEGSKTLHFENRLRYKQGSFCWLSWTAVAENGRIYASARDVTGLKDAAEQLRASQWELAEARRQATMGAVGASIAHELGQPLAAMVTNANAGLRWLAKSEPDLDAVRRILERIVDGGHRASAVINGIRSMFRKDFGERRPLCVNDVIDEVVALVYGELESRHISLQKELCRRLPLVMIEQTQMQQVLLNLIMNALDAMNSVMDRKRVLAVKSARCSSNRVLITIQDSGTGIEPKHMERLFEAFFTTKAHGMGMGLSICRAIVEAHGGRLWASSSINPGSVFNIQLPAVGPGSE
jgi:PAS domain S-box-containing protein